MKNENENEKREFGLLITGIAEIYGRSLSPSALSVYWEALKDIPYEDLRRAAAAVVRSHRISSMPTPAEFIIYTNSNPELKAIRAANCIYERARKPEPSFYFDDPFCDIIVQELGGWQKVCRSAAEVETEEQARKWRSEIERVYRVVYQARSGIPPAERIKMIGTDELRLIALRAEAEREKAWMTDDDEEAEDAESKIIE